MEKSKDTRITLPTGGYIEGIIGKNVHTISILRSNLSPNGFIIPGNSTTFLNNAQNQQRNIFINLYGQKVKISEGSHAELFDNNHIKSIIINSEYTFKTPSGTRLAAKGPLTFYPDGQIHLARQLFNSSLENEIPTPAGTLLSNTDPRSPMFSSDNLENYAAEFHPNGMLKRLELSNKGETEKSSAQGTERSLSFNKFTAPYFTLKAGKASIKFQNRILFYDTGALKKLILSEPLAVVVNKTQFAIQYDLYFHKTGEIAAAKSYGENKINIAGSEFIIPNEGELKWKSDGSPERIDIFPALMKTPAGRQYVSGIYAFEKEKPRGFIFTEPVELRPKSEKISISSARFDNKNKPVEYQKAEFYEWSSDVKIFKNTIHKYDNSWYKIKPHVIASPFGKLICAGKIRPCGKGVETELLYPQKIKTEIGSFKVMYVKFSSTAPKDYREYTAFLAEDTKVRTRKGRFLLRAKTFVRWESKGYPIELHFRKYPKIRVSLRYAYRMKYAEWSERKLYQFALAKHSELPSAHSYSPSGIKLKPHSENTIIRPIRNGKKWTTQYLGYDQHGYENREYYRDE